MAHTQKLLYGFTGSQTDIVKAIVADHVFFKSDPRGEYNAFFDIVDDMDMSALMRRFASILGEGLDLHSPLFEAFAQDMTQPTDDYSTDYFYYLVTQTLDRLSSDERSAFITHATRMLVTNGKEIAS